MDALYVELVIQEYKIKVWEHAKSVQIIVFNVNMKQTQTQQHANIVSMALQSWAQENAWVVEQQQRHMAVKNVELMVHARDVGKVYNLQKKINVKLRTILKDRVFGHSFTYWLLWHQCWWSFSVKNGFIIVIAVYMKNQAKKKLSAAYI